MFHINALDRAQNEWWSSGTCRRTKDIDDNTETKTEKMVETCVTPRLITKESNWRANERKKEAWQDKEMLLDWLMRKEYKMDYSQLKRMTETELNGVDTVICIVRISLKSH